MGSAIFHIVIGLALIVAATRGYTLIFTDSVELLYAAGGAIAALGIYQAIRAHKGH